jgi:hypothetical protein
MLMTILGADTAINTEQHINYFSNMFGDHVLQYVVLTFKSWNYWKEHGISGNNSVVA